MRFNSFYPRATMSLRLNFVMVLLDLILREKSYSLILIGFILPLCVFHVEIIPA